MILLSLILLTNHRTKNLKIMSKRTSINDIKDTEDLNLLHIIVKDKRNEKRANEKKERRNRHYVKLLMKYELKNT